MGVAIKKIAVIGTGVIGASWVINFLENGFQVNAYDVHPDAEFKLREYILRMAPEISQDQLTFERKLEDALKDVQFVQENGPERVDLKESLFEQMDSLTSPEVLLVSSSSGVTPTLFQSKAKYPERILLGHPFNPPHLIPLVEVCGGEKTAEIAISTTIEFYKSIGKKPIRLNKEMKGHVANRLQVALWQEAMYLVKEGVASVEDIDTAIADGPGLRWAFLGPFLNLHLSGGAGGIRHMLEHLGPPMESWMDDLGKISIDQATVELISDKVNEYISQKDIPLMVKERDTLLKELITRKKDTQELG